MRRQLDSRVGQVLARGTVIPAHPLALKADRRLDERRQRALTRYYVAAGAGGLAVGVHTTQFAIRDPDIGLFEPVLKLAAEEMDRADASRAEPLIRIGGICGETAQAVREARLLAELGYNAGLLSLAAMRDADEATLVKHCQEVADILPTIGFYLQPSVGGRGLPYRFWRKFVEIENVVAIKIAPFNRYRTLDVVRGVVEAGAADRVTLYSSRRSPIATRRSSMSPMTSMASSPAATRSCAGRACSLASGVSIRTRRWDRGRRRRSTGSTWPIRTSTTTPSCTRTWSAGCRERRFTVSGGCGRRSAVPCLRAGRTMLAGR